jgi:3-oxoacyl-[acyl-carrier-protein] synthase-3
MTGRMPGLAVPGLALRGVACALPERRVENDEFVERLGEKAVADVTALTGVAIRYWADPSQTAGDLCLIAAERLLSQLDWPRDTVDALIFVSQTPDQRMPATSCSLHGKLGLAAHCQAFDVGLGCSGYVYGVWLAAAMIAAGCRRVLLLAGDTSSRLIDPADRSTALLFGDAGSASALERDEDAPPVHFVLGSDGAGAPHLAVAGGGFRPAAEGDASSEFLVMNGGEVFGFTLGAVPAMIRELLANAGRTAEEVDLFALHQANRFILRHISKKLAISADRMPINIERYGNTSSASIPLLLCTDVAPRLTSGPSDVLLAGFGVGFSWGAALLSGAQLRCAELVTA